LDKGRAAAHLDEARRQLVRGFQIFPDHLDLYRALVQVEVQAEHRAEAVTYLNRAITKAAPDVGKQLLWTLANVLLDGGQRVGARAAIARLVTARVPASWTDFLHARLEIGAGNWATAAGLLEKVRVPLEGTMEVAKQIDILLGQCYEQLEEPRRQLE